MRRVRGIAWALGVLGFLGISSIAAASVTVSPGSVLVKPGGEVQFSATGSADGVVIWGLSGAGCSGLGCGEISSDGLYLAPATAPNPSTVIVTALALSDLSEMGTATVTIGSPTSVAVSLTPNNVTLSINGHQQFTATVTGSSNTGVTWAVSGIGCVAGSCGSISPAGLYTAPSTVPTPALATITATSLANSAESASASVIIQSSSTVAVSVTPASAQVSIGAQQQFSATVTGSTNTAVTWSVSGAGCAGTKCGTISGTGLYTAPSSAPSPATVTIQATSVAAPGQSGTATVTIATTPTLTISPTSPRVPPQSQVQFTASGPQSGIVVWGLSGNGCSGITCGSITSTGLYTAPSTVPSPNSVTVTATSLLNGSISGSTVIVIGAPDNISVTVSPSGPSINTGAQQQFTAAVTGSSNTSVTWSVSGIGCIGSACGTISASGLYTAPSQAPEPAFVTVTATSVADSTKSGSTTVNVLAHITVSISPTSAKLTEGQSQQFSATVAGAASTGVTWSVSGTGCAGSGCGTVSPSGLYTAPDSVPTQVVVTATSVADLAVSASADVTIIPPVVVTISPTSAIVAVSTQQQFQASVSGSSNKSVTWTVSGPGCSGSSCGSVTTAGLYTAPANLPSSATIKVTATSQANGTSAASATVSLVASNNSKLTGQYAFFFSGFDANGAYQAAGSFTADGNGMLVAGEEDMNNFVGPSSSVPIGGTYQVTSDNRGTMTINSALGTFTYKFALNTLGTKGRFVSFDQSGVRGSGIIELQNPTAFDPSVFANGYVLDLSGEDAFGGRVGALGLIFPDGAGFVAGSTLDVNDSGSVAPTYASFFGSYSVDPTGRGTAALMIPGLGSGVLDFTFYVVSANEFLMVSIDPIGQNNLIVGGPALVQNGSPFTASSFDGGSIFNMSGTNGSTPEDEVGRFSFDGASNVQVNFDQNNGGNITVGGLMSGAYDLELNGRGTLNLENPANGGVTVWYIYATGPNQGFVMDASTSAAGLGEITPITIVPPFSNSDILGTYLFASGDPIAQTTPLYSGVSTFDGGSSIQGQGLITGAEDISQATVLSPNQVLTGTYSVSGVSNNGRGSILLTSPAAEGIAVWVASPTEFFGLDLRPSTTQPTILYFEQ